MLVTIKNFIFRRWPLHSAIRDGNAAEVRKLIRKKHNVNATNWKGENALHLAVKLNNIEIVTELLEHGADIEAKDFFGSTALHHAAALKNKEMLGFLLKQRPNINTQSPSASFKSTLNKYLTFPSFAALQLAKLYCWYLTISYSYEWALLLGLEEKLLTPLLTFLGITTPTLTFWLGAVIFLGLHALISKLPKPLVSRIFNYSFVLGILSSIFVPSALPVTLILGLPATLIASYKLGTFIGILFAYPRMMLTRIVVALFAKANQKLANFFERHSESYGGTPLHVAAKFNNLENARLLIEKGADIGATDLRGKKPLEKAFDAKNYDIASLIMRKGEIFVNNNPGMVNPAVPNDAEVAKKIKTYVDNLFLATICDTIKVCKEMDNRQMKLYSENHREKFEEALKEAYPHSQNRKDYQVETVESCFTNESKNEVFFWKLPKEMQRETMKEKIIPCHSSSPALLLSRLPKDLQNTILSHALTQPGFNEVSLSDVVNMRKNLK